MRNSKPLYISTQPIKNLKNFKPSDIHLPVSDASNSNYRHIRREDLILHLTGPTILKNFKLYAWLSMKASCLKKKIIYKVIPGIYAQIGVGSLPTVTGIVIKKLILSIQADELSQAEWLSRKNDLVDYPGIEGGKVDAAFYSKYLETKGIMAKMLADISNETKIYKFALVAYGIGAVYGILTILELLKKSLVDSINVYSYGQPRIGNRIFAEYVDRIKNLLIARITFKDDFVPRMPVNLQDEYLHHAVEYWIASEGCFCDDERVFTCPPILRKINGYYYYGENMNCNKQFSEPNIESHNGPYFSYKMDICLEIPPPFPDAQYKPFDRNWT
ncbi:hypothetical protein G9A89_001401 [Geosiphon pyriformis]|nr:hypothetical protein G9A89_001401 [Geosiphon pyriformis]